MIALLVLLVGGFAGYEFLAFEFRPMNSLPFWRQPVVVYDGGVPLQFFNKFGLQTTTCFEDVYLVTPRYWINDVNPPSSCGRLRRELFCRKLVGIPTPIQVSLIRDGNAQSTVSAVGNSTVLINVHPQTGMPHVILYNLKSHVYTPVDEALSGRGNYLSPAYAVIRKTGAVMLNQPGKPARLLYRLPMSSAALLKFVNRCDKRTGNMWDYDPATDRLAYSTSYNAVTMVVGGKARTWHIPGIVGIHYVYLEPGTHYVWLCEGVLPVNWCLVVYSDYGNPLARSVQGAGIMPWFQPVTQREYQALQKFCLHFGPWLKSHWERRFAAQ